MSRCGTNIRSAFLQPNNGDGERRSSWPACFIPIRIFVYLGKMENNRYTKSNRWFYLVLFFTVFINKNLSAQNNIDSFVNSLHNADAKSVLAWVLPEKTFDTSRIYGQTMERVITNIKVGPIKKNYPKYLMISRLVQSLNDPERDWYADLLLYNLTRISSINIVSCNSRKQWLDLMYNTNITYKETDVKMWHDYLTGLSLSDKW